MPRTTLGLAVVLTLAAPAAWGLILSVEGPPSSHGGAPQHVKPPRSVENDGAAADGMLGFDEAQCVVLKQPLAVDGGTIAPGTAVSSHMVFLNRAGRRSVSHGHADAAVRWTFDGPVLGVMRDRQGQDEAASNGVLGNPGTRYPEPFTARGMEGNAARRGAPDYYRIDGAVLEIGLTVAEPGDWVRVVTAAPKGCGASS